MINLVINWANGNSETFAIPGDEPPAVWRVHRETMLCLSDAVPMAPDDCISAEIVEFKPDCDYAAWCEMARLGRFVYWEVIK